MADYTDRFDVWYDNQGQNLQGEDLARAAYKQALADALDLYDLLDPYTRDMEDVVDQLHDQT